MNNPSSSARTRTLQRPRRRPSRGERVRRRNRGQSVSKHETEKKDRVPPLTKGVRVLPLGGVEEVGKNMTIIETPDDILIVDAGFQFNTEDDMARGIDYILPNTRYLEERKEKIRGLLVTHAHLDHIGGIPFIMNRIGNPPIYTLYLTSVMIKKRQEEFPNMPQLSFKIIEPDERFKVGSTHVTTFPVTHSIPDSVGFVIETAYGNVVITGDLKLEHEDGKPAPSEVKKFEKIGTMNNLIFIADSTNAEKSGFSIPESSVNKNIEEIIHDVKGRLIIGTFASQFARMINIITVAEKLGKKIVTEGRSIRTNIEIAQKTGLIKAKKGTIISAQEIENHPVDKLIIIATGAQGEEHAALMRIASKVHRHIKLNERDTVVLSSSIIPGNEIAVQRLKDNLYRNHIRLIHYRASDVHSTGHGNAGELVWINQKVKARFFMPAYGYYSMTHCHAQAVIDAGFPKENVIIPENGTVIDFPNDRKFVIQKEKAPSSLMVVDGFTIGDSKEIVMRDRETLAKDGMVTIVALVNMKTGKLRKSPDIMSRGFVYIRESQELFQQTRLLTKKTVEQTIAGMHPIDFDLIRKELAEAIGAFLLQKTNKAPLVLPVIIGI